MFLSNFKFSCSFDIFLSIFINTIYPKILNKKFYINEKIINNNKKYKNYIMFIEELSKKNINQKTTFYDIYEEFNHHHKYDLFELD